MIDKSKLVCEHCGGSKHTIEGCFKLIRYPDWWEELKPQKVAAKALVIQTGGKTQMETSNPPITLSPTPEATIVPTTEEKDKGSFCLACIEVTKKGKSHVNQTLKSHI